MRKIINKALVALAVTGLGHAATADTIVSFNTDLGSFQARLYDDAAPISVANFMQYVDAHLYDQSLIHRSVPGFVIQGGGFYEIEDYMNHMVPTFAPIPLENPYGNYRGTLSMARTQDPNSARSQWFINLVDNSNYLDAPTAQHGNEGGYAVFGEIIGDGMAVVDAIAALPMISTGDSVPLLNGNYVRLSITEVPEPRTWILMLLGLMMCGFSLRFKINDAEQSH